MPEQHQEREQDRANAENRSARITATAPAARRNSSTKARRRRRAVEPIHRQIVHREKVRNLLQGGGTPRRRNGTRRTSGTPRIKRLEHRPNLIVAVRRRRARTGTNTQRTAFAILGERKKDSVPLTRPRKDNKRRRIHSESPRLQDRRAAANTSALTASRSSTE